MRLAGRGLDCRKICYNAPPLEQPLTCSKPQAGTLGMQGRAQSSAALVPYSSTLYQQRPRE